MISLRPTLTAIAAALAVAAVSLTACSTGSIASSDAGTAPTGSSADASAFPVSLPNNFGTTVIPRLPQRVATISWTNDDVALALGVIPVAVPRITWGGDAQGSTPWKNAALEKLGAPLGNPKAPTLYSEEDGVNFTALAQAAPDVILAAYSGLSREDYDKLSKIAPVVAYQGERYSTAWQDSTLTIGKALGREGQARDLVTSVQQTIKSAAAAHPQLAGKSFIAANLETRNNTVINLYAADDSRSRFMAELGLTLAPVVSEASKGTPGFYIPWSAEKASELNSNVLLSWLPDGTTTHDLLADPLLGQIPALKKGGLIADSDKTLSLAISASSPLSLPWSLDRILPQMVAAVDASSAH
ncbi:ABC transporter substrate-binding protein [Psychromicrobium xiongbiense]|uniref:ABC transporter substrate-binding protein n=1 Tax=Psychromicrobium xiongbiense TaxID=3051184 RepID=UPI002552E077|nr:ABC transporter substrate-binding protein [Psychromicrobium sp. YIM S02556]